MTVRQATIPRIVADYAREHAPHAEHPIVVDEFRPSTGWKRQTFRKRVSVSWLRKLKAEGVTHVGLSMEPVDRPSNYRGRVADFEVAAVIRGGVR
jgi:hypothetical protein